MKPWPGRNLNAATVGPLQEWVELVTLLIAQAANLGADEHQILDVLQIHARAIVLSLGVGARILAKMGSISEHTSCVIAI